MGERQLTFAIQGEFITKLAKEWMFYEGKDIEKIMDLLLSCMCGTDMSSKELKRQAEDILLGRAEFAGNTADGTFHMRIYDSEEQPDIPSQFDVFRRLSKEIAKRKKAEEERDRYMEWYSVAMEHVPEYAKNLVREETGQPIESRYGSDMIGSFMERMMDEGEHSTGDYGWLEPDGTFHEVDWGNHQEFAEKYIKENMTEEDWITAGVHVPGQFKSDDLYSFGDYLVERGWVLLHNPSQGIAVPTKNPVKRYTKKQQEFLYDYYMERGKEKEANAVYED